ASRASFEVRLPAYPPGDRIQRCQDDGCIGYRFYADLEQPDRYIFIEEWRDDEALQSHFTRPHTAR
ncbi:MAG TPA: antibiotic biosynthesis monooxygenase, partial [Solirubrobacteraceae bacterium]